MRPAPGAADSGDGTLSIARCVAQPDDRQCTIVLSDGRSFELAAAAPELAQARPGRRVDAELLAQLEHAAERRRLARRVFAELARRPAARARIRERLRRETQDEPALETVLDEFAAQGLLDDRAFASQFIEDQLRARAIGPLSLLQRLAQQGVPLQLAQSAVGEAVDFEREVELATRALGRRAAGKRIDAREHSRQARFLRSRGFGARAIRAVLGRIEAADAADGDTID
jgi:regulatory protein